MTRSSRMRVQLNIWIENPEGKLLFGEGRHQILEAIDRHGSLAAAAEALEMSYRGLWARMRHSEKRLGFRLIESHAGRGPDSGTALTPEGRALMERYGRLRRASTEATHKAFDRIFGDSRPRGSSD